MMYRVATALPIIFIVILAAYYNYCTQFMDLGINSLLLLGKSYYASKYVYL